MSERETITQEHLSSAITGTQRLSPRMARLAGYIIGVVLVMALSALGFWITTVLRGNPAIAATSPPAIEPTVVVPLALQRPVVTEDGLVEKIGVKIVYVAVTGDGGLIDFRFQVIDPEKANAIHDENNPPTLVDEATGLVVNSLLIDRKSVV